MDRPALGTIARNAAAYGVMAPSMLGKTKTSVQFLAITLAILRLGDPIGPLYLDEWAMLVAAAVTVWSAVDYLIRAIPMLTAETEGRKSREDMETVARRVLDQVRELGDLQGDRKSEVGSKNAAFLSTADFLAWTFRPPRAPRGSFRRPLRPRGVRILDVCPIRLRSKRPCVLDGDENLSLGHGLQVFRSSNE